jgi:hypothetical protein
VERAVIGSFNLKEFSLSLNLEERVNFKDDTEHFIPGSLAV